MQSPWPWLAMIKDNNLQGKREGRRPSVEVLVVSKREWKDGRA